MQLFTPQAGQHFLMIGAKQLDLAASLYSLACRWRTRTGLHFCLLPNLPFHLHSCAGTLTLLGVPFIIPYRRLFN